MDLSTLSPAAGARKKRKRVGRGPASGTGKTSGRGHKGQKSRSGYSRRAGFEGGQMPLHRRLPKRGFRHSSRHPQAGINVDVLDRAFSDGDEVTAATVFERNLAKSVKGGIKILGRGELTKKLTVKTEGISASAREKIEGAGGTVELVEVPVARAIANRTKGASRKDR